MYQTTYQNIEPVSFLQNKISDSWEVDLCAIYLVVACQSLRPLSFTPPRRCMLPIPNVVFNASLSKYSIEYLSFVPEKLLQQKNRRWEQSAGRLFASLVRCRSIMLLFDILKEGPGWVQSTATI
jgi:hypothetical protein